MGNSGAEAVRVRGETFSGEDFGGMGPRGGRVRGRGGKGLKYSGTEVGGFGSTGAVKRTRWVDGFSVFGWGKWELAPERRLSDCVMGLGIVGLCGSDGTTIADDTMSDKKFLTLGARGRSGMLTLCLLGATGVTGVRGASIMVAEGGSGVMRVHGLSGMEVLPSMS